MILLRGAVKACETLGTLDYVVKLDMDTGYLKTRGSDSKMSRHVVSH